MQKRVLGRGEGEAPPKGRQRGDKKHRTAIQEKGQHDNGQQIDQGDGLVTDELRQRQVQQGRSQEAGERQRILLQRMRQQPGPHAAGRAEKARSLRPGLRIGIRGRDVRQGACVLMGLSLHGGEPYRIPAPLARLKWPNFPRSPARSGTRFRAV